MHRTRRLQLVCCYSLSVVKFHSPHVTLFYVQGGGTDRIFVLIVKKSSARDDKDLLQPTRFNPREEEGPCASSPGQTSVPSRRPATPSFIELILFLWQAVRS